MEICISFLKSIESFFSDYPFSQDFVIACLGVVFGGMVTVLINKGAIRKQAYFDLQYKILNEIYDGVFELEKNLESVEIGLSFGDMTTKSVLNDIKTLESNALKLNEIFREKRSLVHKYVSGTMLEESAHIPGKLYGVLYDNIGPIMEEDYKEKVSVEDISTLRKLTADTRKLKNKVLGSLERLIYPSFFSAITRKVKKAKVFIGNLYGVYIINKKENKRTHRR